MKKFELTDEPEGAGGKRMRLIDADALLEHQVEADKMGAMLVVGKGFIMDAPTITPQPDPDTGLVPCGCGGKAGFHYSVMMRDNDCYVECGICGGHTKVVLSEDKARDAWNTAMGWKGGAE